MEDENSLNERRAAADAMCVRVEDVQIIEGIPEYRPSEARGLPNNWVSVLLQDGPLPDEP
jgi:hypothetical protein